MGSRAPPARSPDGFFFKQEAALFGMDVLRDLVTFLSDFWHSREWISWFEFRKS